MQTHQVEIPVRKKRTFLPDTLVVDDWKKIEPFFIALKERTLHSAAELEQWLKDRSELESALQEDLGWRYIRMSCDITDKAASASYQFFISEIEPHMAPYENELNQILLASPFLATLSKEKYFIYLRGIKKQTEIFREKNIPLFTEMQTEEQKYAEITGVMTVTIKGEELTLQKASNYLQDTDRTLRKETFCKIVERRTKDREALNTLYDTLLKTRQQIATNAGFENYRDYMFAALGRFDYSVQDCLDFHDAIGREIVPLVEYFQLERRKKLNLNTLRPWDTETDATGQPPLRPFQEDKTLINKTIECFHRIDPFLGNCMEVMREMKHIDLDSRKGKAPGGYNYPLNEIGVPFIFMNATNSLNDIVTMVHEGGHAVHSFLTRDLELAGFKSTPSEVAELASMSMELISMEHWDVFFENEKDLKRAKQQQLEKIISILPWVAAIDKFQHWVYTHPGHTPEARTNAWSEIYAAMSGKVIDWEGQKNAFENAWQRQLHLYQVPFYYVEYGMAQLGAIAVWRNYKKNPGKALNDYMNALRLGYTRSIPEIYRTAGIEFNFSERYVKELAAFVSDELSRL